MKDAYEGPQRSKIDIRSELIRSIRNIQHDDSTGKFDVMVVTLVNVTNYTVMSTMGDSALNNLTNTEKSWLVRIWLDVCLRNTVEQMNTIFITAAFSVLEVVRNSRDFLEQDPSNSITMLNDAYANVNTISEVPEIDAFKKAALLISINLNDGDFNEQP